MKADFWEFHKNNKHVYAKFDSYVSDIVQKLESEGKLFEKYVPLRMIFESIRLDIWIQTLSTDGYKINNNHFKFYAFLWQKRNPQYAGVFRHRGYVPDTIRQLIDLNKISNS